MGDHGMEPDGGFRYHRLRPRILAALAVNIWFAWWWADALAALGIGMFAAKQGLESLQKS